MAETQFETDEFLKLLTEALRAGPGSPPWHDALAQLKAGSLTAADEYKLLMSVREDLESGRDYRSVRPGPGFTRKVMGRIDDETASRGRGLPTATLIAMIAGAVIVAVIAVVAVVLIRSHPKEGIETLAATDFFNQIISSDFSQKGTADWDKWAKFGDEPVLSERDKGLRVPPASGGDAQFKTGGIHVATPVPATQSFCIEAKVQMAKATSQVYVQFFVSDDPKAASPREFVVSLTNGDLESHKPDGSLAGSFVHIAPGVIKLAIKMNQEFVIVEGGDKELYRGPHGLSGKTPRYPGLRFGVQGGKDNGLEDVVVQSLRVRQP